jgi:hypothetical protein
MALTQGHQIICCDRNRRGGVKRIWLAEQGIAPAIAPVYATSGQGPGGDTHGGEIISFQSILYGNIHKPGPGWFEFEFERGSAGFTANAVRENGSTQVAIELEFYIPKVTEEINARLRELTESCGIYSIIETYADDCDTVAPETYFFLLGYDKVFEQKAYLEFVSGEQASGIGLQDANGTGVKLSGLQAEYPREIMVLLNYTNVAAPSASWVDMYQPVTGTVLKWETD